MYIYCLYIFNNKLKQNYQHFIHACSHTVAKSNVHLGIKIVSVLLVYIVIVDFDISLCHISLSILLKNVIKLIRLSSPTFLITTGTLSTKTS